MLRSSEERKEEKVKRRFPDLVPGNKLEHQIFERDPEFELQVNRKRNSSSDGRRRSRGRTRMQKRRT
ncbi:hypothetical protein BT69DRAFT_1287702 [Atractiella rhizophila]|nr:hypothetical protein BT69DRAFT_1287702 [Atractiella rhizophila]